MKRSLSKYLSGFQATVLFYLITVALMESQYLLFLRQISDGESWIQMIARTSGEVLTITSPYWFAGPKWRRLLMVIPVLGVIFTVPNLLLFREWGDIMGISYLQFTGNINSNLLLSAVSLWRPMDWWIVIMGFLPIGLYFILRPLDYKFKRLTSLTLTGLSLLLCIGGYGLRIRGIHNYYNQNPESRTSWRETLGIYMASNQQNSTALVNGALVYLKMTLNDLPEVISTGHIDLSHKEREEIKGELEAVPFIKFEEFEGNVNKNLILVIVESLDSYVVDLVVNGEEVSPNLNRLLKEEGVIQARKVISQVGEGRSIDGQLILTTGLLPLRKGITWMKAPGYFAEVPSLPKLFGENSFCLFSTDGKYWQEESFEKLIGTYDTGTEADYRPKIEEYGADGALFRKGLEIARKMQQPFMLTLVTSSMHTPFSEPKADLVPAFHKADPQEGKYMDVTRYFDRELGQFISELKKEGLYDNSVIVVVSDHTRTRNFGNQKDMETFFAAFNTGRKEKIERIVGQVNLYPTILTIMNRGNASGYKGIAPSIFDPEVRGASDAQGNVYGSIDEKKRSPYEISEKMIRGELKY